jgi:hypothetical protein
MFRNFFAVIMAYVVIGTWAFSGKGKEAKPTEPSASSITGKVSPADAANSVMVVSGKDTLHGPLANGIFTVAVKPGVHQLIVDARAPYRDALLDNLSVTENDVLDVGEIVLKQ